MNNEGLFATLSTDLFQRGICVWLSPPELMRIAAVSHTFYNRTRSNGAWAHHAARVLRVCPEMQVVFDAYGPRKGDTYRALNKTKSAAKKRKRAWVLTKGYWYGYKGYLCILLVKD